MFIVFVKRYIVLFAALFFLTGISAFSIAGDNKEDKAAENVRKAMLRIIPDKHPDEIVLSTINGIYEVSYGSDIFYVSADGNFLIHGDMFDLQTLTNLSDKKRSFARLELMKGVDPEEAIIFAPKKPKYVLNVFTDVDCTYCRKLHREIDSYTQLGIEIRYLAFPRSGINTPSYFKAVSVWCSPNRQEAITTAKNGQEIPTRTCDNPVLKQMTLAEKIGVTGTPTLVLADGSIIPGYVPAARLIKMLDEKSAQ